MFAHMPIIRDIFWGAVSRGADMAELCKKTGIDMSQLNDSEKKLDFLPAYQVWEHAVRLSGDKMLGLHLGEFTNPSILGLVGHLMQSSPDLKAAFENVCRYGEIATDMFRYSIRKKDDHYIIQFEPATVWIRQSPDSARQAVEQAMAGTLNVFYLLSGDEIYPVQSTFHYKRSMPLAEYERVFRSQLLFNSEANQLIFEYHQLEKTVLSYDRSLYKIFDKMLSEKGTPRLNERFSLRLKHVVLSEFSGQVPSIGVLAAHLGLTTRSLQRKLEAESTTFRKVTANIKKDLAGQFLSNQEMKVGYVAKVLGYSEASAFRRAFKSWTNSSPRKSKAS
ncbi:AraC family transcriptional regulator [soil metagenome]